MILYLDSSHYLSMGLLSSSNHEWIDFKTTKSKKNSEIIHFQILEMLKKANSSLHGIERIVTCLGPGSYTGMRLVEGLVQILELDGYKRCSFYHFEIPKLTGVPKGKWISHAYKKQTFVYEWSPEGESKTLVDQDSVVDKSGLYTHFDDEEREQDLVETSKLIENRPSEVFPKIIERNAVLGPFYYRTLDQEFSKSTR